jgi:hypothetical protein
VLDAGRARPRHQLYNPCPCAHDFFLKVHFRFYNSLRSTQRNLNFDHPFIMILRTQVHCTNRWRDTGTASFHRHRVFRGRLDCDTRGGMLMGDRPSLHVSFRELQNPCLGSHCPHRSCILFKMCTSDTFLVFTFSLARHLLGARGQQRLSLILNYSFSILQHSNTLHQIKMIPQRYQKQTLPLGAHRYTPPQGNFIDHDTLIT